MQFKRNTLWVLFSTFLILTATACQDAKIKVKFKSSNKAGQAKPSGQNPINTSSIGAFSGVSSGNYKLSIKVGGAAIPTTLTTGTGPNYRIYTKVVVQ